MALGLRQTVGLKAAVMEERRRRQVQSMLSAERERERALAEKKEVIFTHLVLLAYRLQVLRPFYCFLAVREGFGMRRRVATAASSPEVDRFTDACPCSAAESSFRELDDVFLQTETRIWLGEVLHTRFDEETAIADLLADGELLFQVSQVVWKMLVRKHVEIKHSKVHIYEKTSSGKKDGRYMPYPKVDSFLKICQLLGLSGADLFSPSDVVEKRYLRRICMCIRSFSKKVRLKDVEVPDFDIVTYTVAMPTDFVGGLRRNLEQSQCTSSSSSGYSLGMDSSEIYRQQRFGGGHAQNDDPCSEYNEAENAYPESEFQSPCSDTSYNDSSPSHVVDEISSDKSEELMGPSLDPSGQAEEVDFASGYSHDMRVNCVILDKEISLAGSTCTIEEDDGKHICSTCSDMGPNKLLLRGCIMNRYAKKENDHSSIPKRNAARTVSNAYNGINSRVTNKVNLVVSSQGKDAAFSSCDPSRKECIAGTSRITDVKKYGKQALRLAFASVEDPCSKENIEERCRALPLVSEVFSSMKHNEINDNVEGIKGLDLDQYKTEEVIVPTPGGKDTNREASEPHKPGRKMLKSIAGGFTLVGAMFLFLYLREGRGKDENRKTNAPLQTQKSFHSGKIQVETGNSCGLYPAERLKF